MSLTDVEIFLIHKNRKLISAHRNALYAYESNLASAFDAAEHNASVARRAAKAARSALQRYRGVATRNDELRAENIALKLALHEAQVELGNALDLLDELLVKDETSAR